MNNNIEANNKEEVSAQHYWQLEGYLKNFGLPSDNIIASNIDRETILHNLPALLSRLAPEVKKDANYLSKFAISSSIGLFDAALNYLWNEVIINIRKTVIDYGLDLFYDTAIHNKNRDAYNDIEDLQLVKDTVLLDTCKKLELISNIAHMKLRHILDMRNHIGASHPNENLINPYELIGWLEYCITDIISKKISPAALSIKQIITNIKSKNTNLSLDDVASFECSVKELTPHMVNNLVNMLFGVFVSTKNTNNSILHKNILQLGQIVWKYSSEDNKYKIGSKLDSYKANFDEYKTNQTNIFFEYCNAKKYLSRDRRSSQLGLLCDQLDTAHNGWDNFAHEVSIAKEISSYFENITDIPEEKLHNVIYSFLICRIGKDCDYNEGVSKYAKDYYDRLFKMMDDNAVKITLKFLFDTDYTYLLQGNYRPKHIITICKYMNINILSERCQSMLKFIIEYEGKLTSIQQSTRFKDLSTGLLL